MEVAKQALQLLKDQNTTLAESKCMSDYCKALVEIECMKTELNDSKDKKSKNYKLKKKRIEILDNSVHSFYDSYFNMAKYKEMYIRKKQELIQKEITFLSSISKA